MKYPFVVKRGDRFVETICKLGCYPVDVDVCENNVDKYREKRGLR